LPANEVHLNDYGTVFRFTLYNRGRTVNLANPVATTKDFIFVDPDGNSFTKAGAFYTDGSDSIVEYATLAGFINKIGTWRVQVYIETVDGGWYSDIHTFEVYANA
jgi:hypothetical protein